MSWLYSQALVEEFLQENYSDGEQSVPLSGNLIQQQSLPKDKMKKFLKLSQFGMTFKPLTDDLGKELLTWYQEGFRAKIFQQQEKEPEYHESEVQCGSTCSELQKKSNQGTSGLKTHPCSEQEVCTLSSKGCMKQGIMLHGVCYPLKTVVPTINGNECGFLLNYPTPTCHNAKEGGYLAEGLRKTPTLGWVVGGKLNPMWVEWLMAWPLGWSDLKPLETDKYQSWRQQHSCNFNKS